VNWQRALGGASPPLHVQIHSELHSSEDAVTGSACHALAESRSATGNEIPLWTKIASIS
jgi:hypothetical protein